MAATRGSAHTGPMAIGEHPQRTPFYGIVLIVGVMIAATLISHADVPGVAKVVVYVAAAAGVVFGAVMTLRDLS